MAKARAKKKPAKARKTRKEVAAEKRERKARAKAIRVAAKALLKKARQRVAALEKHERNAGRLASSRNPQPKAVGLLAARHAQLSGGTSVGARARRVAKPALSFEERVVAAVRAVPEKDTILDRAFIASVYDAGGFAGDMTLEAFKEQLFELQKAATDANPKAPRVSVSRLDLVGAMQPHHHPLYERSEAKRRGVGSHQHLVTVRE